ncbi:MAG: (2Fe-2S)-binding protein [Burkholderiaceae bacterium]
MIICVCRAVSDRQIRSVVQKGASSMAEVRSELGTGECCGKCSRQVRELIDLHRCPREAADLTQGCAAFA